MQERIANNRQLRISSELQEYINELVKEVVLNGKDFNSQKKWLKKYVEAEGGDYNEIESNLLLLFSCINKGGQSSQQELNVLYQRSLSKYIYEEVFLLLKDLCLNYGKSDLVVLLEGKLNNFPKIYKEGGIDVFNNYQKRINLFNKYDFVGPFQNDIAVVEKKGKSGYVDVKGNQITDLIYYVASVFKNGKAVVSKEEGLIFKRHYPIKCVS